MSNDLVTKIPRKNLERQPVPEGTYKGTCTSIKLGEDKHHRPQMAVAWHLEGDGPDNEGDEKRGTHYITLPIEGYEDEDGVFTSYTDDKGKLLTAPRTGTIIASLFAAAKVPVSEVEDRDDRGAAVGEEALNWGLIVGAEVGVKISHRSYEGRTFENFGYSELAGGASTRRQAPKEEERSRPATTARKPAPKRR